VGVDYVAALEKVQKEVEKVKAKQDDDNQIDSGKLPAKTEETPDFDENEDLYNQQIDDFGNLLDNEDKAKPVEQDSLTPYEKEYHEVI